MELKQLEIFTAAAENKSFSEAARQLYLSQPSVSTHVARLEDELGKRLFVRTGKELKLTEDGRRLLDSARTMLALRDRTLESFHPNKQTVLRVGGSTIPAAYLLPELFKKLRELRPALRILFWQGDSYTMSAKTAAGTLDLAFVGAASDNPALKFIPFSRDELVLIAPPEKRFERMIKTGNLTALLTQPFILREEGSGTRKEASRFLESLQIRPEMLNAVAYISDPEAVKNAVRSGLGVSMISHHAVRALEDRGELLVYKPEKPFKRDLYIAVRKNESLSEPATLLVSLAEQA